MEYPFGQHIEEFIEFINSDVLILLLVEYPFGPQKGKLKLKGQQVLILLLVEYPFGPDALSGDAANRTCLNPSFSGISFRTEFFPPFIKSCK